MTERGWASPAVSSSCDSGSGSARNLRLTLSKYPISKFVARSSIKLMTMRSSKTNEWEYMGGQFLRDPHTKLLVLGVFNFYRSSSIFPRTYNTPVAYRLPDLESSKML